MKHHDYENRKKVYKEDISDINKIDTYSIYYYLSIATFIRKKTSCASLPCLISASKNCFVKDLS